MKNMRINKGIVSLAIVVAGATGVSQISAVSARGIESPHSTVSPSSVAISQARAVEIAQGQLAGTMKKAFLKKKQGKAIWRITILSTDGLQRGDFRIDATTGAVLQSKIKPVGTKTAHETRLSEKVNKNQ
jgi:uncharacterized membrane protein YkoI